MKILITGGYGYLGAKLIRLLSDKGYKIRIFSPGIPKNNQKARKHEIFLGNIMDRRKIEKACKGVDYVLHLAGLNQQKCKKNPRLALLVNGLGTKIVLEEAKKAYVKKFICMSTSQVYGRLEGRVTEKTIPAPINDYGITKLLGELYCRQFNDGMECIIMRLSNGYGAPLNDSGGNLVVDDLCRQAVKKQKITLKTRGNQKRDFIAVSDIGQAIDILLNCKSKDLGDNIFNVGGDTILSIYELAKLIAQTYFEAYGKKVKIDFAEDLIEEQATNFIYSISRIRKLGFKPKLQIKEGIKEMLNAFGGGNFG